MKTLRKTFRQTLRVLFVFAFILTWEFSAWPQLFSFPPTVPEAHAAATLVQAKGKLCSNCGSLAISPTSSIAANHLLIVFAMGCSVLAGGGCTTAATISDTANNTWSSPITEDVNESDGEAYMWYACASKSGSDTITVTEPANLDLHVHVYEVDGITTANCLDTSGTAETFFGHTTAVAYTAGSVIQSSEYVVAFFTDWDTNATWTQGSGYTTQVQTNNSTTNDSAMSEDGNAKTGLSGSQSTTVTLSNADHWRGIIATFKALPPAGIGASSRSDELSDSRLSTTSNHTIAFTANSAIQGSLTPGSSSTLALSFPSSFTVPPNFNCGDVDAATSSQFNFNYSGCAATATAWGLTVQTGHALVQARHVGADSAASHALAFRLNTTAGNTIIVGAMHVGGNFSSISDTQGNTYINAVTSATTVGNQIGHIFYAANIKGGADTITVNYASTVLNDLLIGEYSGLALTNVLDKTSSAIGSGTAVNSGSATTLQANELIVGFNTCDSCNLHTPGSLFTTRDYFDADLNEDRVVSAIGSYSATSTLDSSGGWLSTMATFKLNSLPLGSLTLIPPTDTAVHVATGTPVTINLGLNATIQQQGVHTITNPSTAGTYTIALGGTSGNSGNFDVATVPAAINLVQSNSNACAGTVCTCVLNKTVAQGDLVILGAEWGNNAAGTLVITDNASASGTPNTYTSLPGSPVSDGAGGGNELFVNYAVNVENPGPVTYTFTISGGGSHSIYPSCFEYSAAGGWTKQASVLDTSNTNSNAASVSSGNGGNITPAAAGELIWSGIQAGINTGPYTVSTCNIQDTDSNSLGTGWGGANRRESADIEYATTNQTTCTFNFSSTGPYSAAIAAFKPASASPGLTISAMMAESLAFTVSSVPGNAISFVQGNLGNINGSLANLLVGNVGSGDLIIACADWANNVNTNVLTVTDLRSNSYSPVTAKFINGNATQCFYAQNAYSGSTTVTFTWSQDAGGTDETVQEYSGIATSGALDQSATGTGTSATPSATTSAPTAQANELVFGFENHVSPAGSITAGAGFTVRESDNAFYASEDLTATTTGIKNANWTLNVSEQWGALVGTFKASSNCTADDGATISAIATTPTTVPFGTVNPNTFYQGCQDLLVSTNAGGGYSLAAQENSALLASNGQTIPDTKCDNGLCTAATATPWASATNNGFGHTCTNQSNHDCNSIYSSGMNFRPFTTVPQGMPLTPQFVQLAFGNCNSGCVSEPLSFASNNTAGDLIVVSADWDSVTASVASITDTNGNTYVSAVGPVNWNSDQPSSERAQIFYAKNIKAGANTVTVNLTSPPFTVFKIFMHEYSGINTASPLDVVSSATSSSGTTLNSGTSTTNFANELIFGYGVTPGVFSAPGTGFAIRTSLAGNTTDMTEDKNVFSKGPYNATETNDGSSWTMLMATFRAAPSAAEVLMSSSTPAIATGRIKFRLSVGSQQPAGVYSNTIDYILIGTY